MAKKKKKTKLETFAEAAEELNQVLGLEPPIETEGASVNELAGKIREASELLYEDDEITDATAAVIADLTEVVDELDEQEEGEEEVQDAEVVEETEFEESEEEDEEELTLEDLREEVEGLHKRKDMRLLVEEIDLFESLIEKLPDLKSGSALKGAMLKILDAEMVQTDGSDEPEEAPESKKEKPVEKKAEKLKPKKVSKPKSGTKTAQAIEYITPYIEEGKYTEKELIDITAENADIAWATAHMLIAKSKNPKYSKFKKVLQKDPETGIISF